MFVYIVQYDPEGFGEIPLEDFLTALNSPEWKAEIPTNKRDILLTRAKESRVQAVTFQDFINVVSLYIMMAYMHVFCSIWKLHNFLLYTISRIDVFHYIYVLMYKNNAVLTEYILYIK